jgi:lipopolysaccharide transport protein LptA
MRRLTAAALILLILGSPGWAATEGQEGEVRIFSDSLRIMDKTGEVQFEGSVKVQLSGTTLTCDRLIVNTSAEDPSKVVSGTATGKVVMERGQERIEAGEARFDLRSSTVDLTGSPVLFKGSTTIHAERIVYLLEEGTATFDGPVRAVFTGTEE